MTVYPLTGTVRPYAWGSRTVIAALQGRPAPTEGPEAELWLGAHPGDPSTVTGPDGPASLADLIADDPKGQLGDQVVAEFGTRLPFLLKVLAAEKPLSLQAHPDEEYARQAFAKQEADPEAPRNYTDAYHKPEVLVALTPFEALCGFRDPAVSADVLEALGIASLAPVVDALRDGDLRTAVRTLLTWPQADRPALVGAVAAAARRDGTAAAAGADAAMAVAGADAGMAVAGVDAGM
ncbi:MAG: mannose-6-phosphate isomerase, class I, partial [Catenulispora sp.]